MSETLTIAPRATGNGKGRTFKVSLLGFLTADGYHDKGSSRAYRPVYLSVAESDAQVRAFVANLRTGREAEVRDAAGNLLPKMLEIPRGIGLRWHFKKMEKPAGVTVATGYLPDLCDLDPGILQEDIRFLFAPPRWWVERELQAPSIQALPEAIRREAVIGQLFAAFLDKRSPLPIVPDPLFHRRLYVAARGLTWFAEPDGTKDWAPRMFRFPGTGSDGLELVAGVKVSHEQFENVLRDETARYFAEESPAWLLEPVPEVERVPVRPIALAPARNGHRVPVAEELGPCAPEIVHPQEPEPEEVAVEVDEEAVQASEIVHPLPAMVPRQVSLFDLL